MRHMMKNISVSAFIHILFSVAIAVLVITLLLFLSWDKDRKKIDEFKRYQLISITFLSKLQVEPSATQLEEIFDELSLKPLSSKNRSVKHDIMQHGKTLFSGGSEVGRVRVFELEDERYIYVQRMQHNLLLQDDKGNDKKIEVGVAIGVVILLLVIFVYIAILKKLYPLKRLHREIQAFATGNMYTPITYESRDEIGRIAKSFNDAIVHINHLSASKALFMRNLMHELKTPITKGRIVAEMIEDDSSKKTLINAFERMNELISELAEVERITTQRLDANFEKVSLNSVVQTAQRLLLTDKSKVEVYIEDRTLTTDKKLLSLAIKNLLDNGIKYSPNKKVILQTQKERIEVLSQGEKLQQPLNYYLEPFSQEEKRSTGFGLGLYIVNAILEKLGYRLEYRYENGMNIFTMY
jgi:two-component system OmpR family sensor kinase